MTAAQTTSERPDEAWAAMGLNVIWVLIALAALARIAMERKRGDEALKKGKT